MILLDIFTFLGRMHPLIVHFPIGFLLLAIIFEGVSYRNKYAFLKGAVPFTLLMGFSFGVAACVLGFLLSRTGDYDEQTLSNHKTSGILLTLMAGILYGLTTAFFRKIILLPRGIFSTLALTIFLFLIYTGHQGANLTHGSNYITLQTLMQQERQKPKLVEDAMIFEDIVHPILEKRCFQCHRRDKKKGQLSMENLATMLKGGKHGPSVVPGNLEESELFRRITLDAAHDDFMPADGKTPLTSMETEVIRWWIEKAMAVEKKKIAELKDHAQIKPLLASVLELGGYGEMIRLAGQHVNSNIPDTLDMTLVENLRKTGMVVRVMFQKPLMLDVTLPSRSGKKIIEFENDLKPLVRNIIWLNFSDNNATESELGIIKDMENLEKLRLEKNPISDGISDYLEGLQYLEAVNLNETKITNVCLRKLQKNASIKRIYTWKTMCEGLN
ncbi:MAG: c-type cytochrome domain-containing protein [Cyclobacteriaceae bacterium]